MRKLRGPLSEEHRAKLRENHKGTSGQRCSPETRQKISAAQKGRPRWTPEQRRLISERQRGRIITPEHRLKLSDALRGPKSPRWITDRSALKKSDRQASPGYYQWRASVYTRDRFKCRLLSPSCHGRISAHHILPWRTYIDRRYDVSNGITLCHFHHPRKRSDESRLSPLFQAIIGQVVQSCK